jgi:glycosyltransferase involved in cell wall biosynthesis
MSSRGADQSEQEQVTDNFGIEIVNIGVVTDPLRYLPNQKERMGKTSALHMFDILADGWNKMEEDCVRPTLDMMRAANDTGQLPDVLLCDAAATWAPLLAEHFDMADRVVAYSTVPPSHVANAPLIVPPAGSGGVFPAAFGDRLARLAARLFTSVVLRPKFGSARPWHVELGVGEAKRRAAYLMREDERLCLHVMPFGLEYPHALPPSQIVVGPTRIFDRQTLPPIDDALAEWLDRSDAPVLLVAMGTTAEPPRELMELVAGSLGLLKRNAADADSLINAHGLRVVWSLPNIDDADGSLYELVDGLVEASDTFFPTHWMPQSSVLADERIRWFWTHGGANSIVEALSFGKPVIVSPVVFDQYDNAQRAYSHGYGIRVDYAGTDIADARALVAPIFDSDCHHDAARRAATLLRLHKGASRAADIVELVAHVGYSHLIIPPYPWYYVYNIDIIALVAVATLIVVIALRLICRCCCSRCRSTKEKQH